MKVVKETAGKASGVYSSNGRRFAILAILAICAAVSGGSLATIGNAYAGDESGSKSKSTWTISFGSNVNYGSNHTKGSGVMKEESRPVANFSRLTLSLPATVTLAQGPTESLTITTDDNLLPLMRTRVVNNELIVDGEQNRGFSTKKEIKIRITVKSLDSLKIKGSGDVFGDQLKSEKLDIAIEGSGDVKFNAIRADQFKIGIVGSGDVAIGIVESKSVDSSIRGSGDIKLPSVRAGQMKFAIEGSGDVTAAGNADKVDIEISGSGDVRARKLVAREVDVRVIAAGDADVHATEKLTATVTGSGDIRYAGSPKKVERNVKGSGSIESL
jgi:Putative auto-transporter adhesin, head GIN domain